MLRLISPAGTPTPLSIIARAVARRAASGGREFSEMVRQSVGAHYCFPVSSGRAAQTLILRAMITSSDGIRDEVIIPAYTCYTVPASVVKAGLRVRPVDIDPVTMDYRPDALRSADFSRVLAINSSNLFGIVSDWDVINELAEKHGCYRIDDAAQSFGTTTHKGKSGMLGDVGFFSLDRGKNLSTYSGGVIVTNNRELGDAMAGAVDELAEPGFAADLMLIAKLVAYSLLLRPRLYWIPASLPFLGLGETVYDEEFWIGNLSKLQASLGELTIKRLGAFNDHRRAVGEYMAKRLADSGRFTIAGYDPAVKRTYLRLPVLAPDREARDKAIADLKSIGVSASTMYPDTVAKVPQLQAHLANSEEEFQGAKEVVNRLFTLPTHGYLYDRDADRIISCLIEGRP